MEREPRPEAVDVPVDVPTAVQSSGAWVLRLLSTPGGHTLIEGEEPARGTQVGTVQTCGPC